MKIVTPLRETHEKDQSVERGAGGKKKKKQFGRRVCCVESCLEISLNRPQRIVSVATVKSGDLLHWGLKRMESLLSVVFFSFF